MGFSAITPPAVDLNNPWQSLMAPATGTLIKYDLPLRLGRKRSIALEVEKNSRFYRIRARDYSRDQPVAAKSLGLKCPLEVRSSEEAIAYIQNHPEIWLFFLAMKEEMEAGVWPNELRQKNAAAGKKAASRVFPHGSVGHVLRWYLGRKGVGSDDQKQQFADIAREIITIADKRGEAYGHIDVSDLTITHVEDMHTSWTKADRSQTSFRHGCTLLSAALNKSLQYHDETGAQMGPGWGSPIHNPFNTLRNALDHKMRLERYAEGKWAQPLQPDECRAVLEIMRRDPLLNPYWPLAGLLLATGARPNEILALQWRNVLGLWEGHTNNPDAAPLKDEDFRLHGDCILIERGVRKYSRTDWSVKERFKSTKNADRRIPKANRFIPGYDDLLKKAILARLPADRKLMNAPQWRYELVFQGPGASDPHMPYDWHNFGRYWKRTLELADIRHRNAYQMRHTYVSLMRNPGNFDFDQIAGWIGDNPKTMRARYLGVINGGL